jgi:hypothetical protein
VISDTPITIHIKETKNVRYRSRFSDGRGEGLQAEAGGDAGSDGGFTDETG